MADEAVSIARQIVAIRARRGEIFGAAMFGEAIWSLLLALFIAGAEGRGLGSAEAIALGGGSDATITRVVAILRRRALVTGDVLSGNLALTEEAREKMRATLLAPVPPDATG